MKWNKTECLKWGITLVLFLVGLYCYMKDYGYASEYSIPVHQEYLFKHLEGRSNWEVKPGRPKSNSQNQRHIYQEAYDDHHFNAVRTYNDAYNRVWFLPDLTWRQVGRDCWVAACSTVGGASPSARLVIAFGALLSSYGLHCLDEWDYIQDKLYWSQYHFDQCKYYADLLNK